METAESVINDALQEILVQASEQDLQAVDFQAGRRYLNRMMATSPYNLLGFTVITNPSDNVTVVDEAIEGVIFNLAKRLLTSYDVALTTELNMSANDGLKTIRRITTDIRPTQFSSTLPIGSGNDIINPVSDFFPPSPEELLTEGDGIMILESDT
jgi:hypothetical protein